MTVPRFGSAVLRNTLTALRKKIQGKWSGADTGFPKKAFRAGISAIDRLSDAVLGAPSASTETQDVPPPPKSVEALMKQKERKKKYALITNEEREFFKASVKALLSQKGRWTFLKYRAYVKVRYLLFCVQPLSLFANAGSEYVILVFSRANCVRVVWSQ